VYATYTTNYVNNANRTTNLKLACKAINGTIVYPGETFSFNEVVGKRTEAKGYKNATIFTGSTGTAQGVGGGICQVASTMFNTTLIANLGIVERYQHSQRVSYCPLGRDAAIYWGSEDFRFKNNTNYPIKISMKCADGKLTATYYVSSDVSPKKVKLTVTQSGKTFTLKRSVDGKVNYTCKSTY
jgi:vancomycin resistance protein YoaR